MDLARILRRSASQPENDLPVDPLSEVSGQGDERHAERARERHDADRLEERERLRVPDEQEQGRHERTEAVDDARGEAPAAETSESGADEGQSEGRKQECDVPPVVDHVLEAALRPHERVAHPGRFHEPDIEGEEGGRQDGFPLETDDPCAREARLSYLWLVFS